MIEICIRLAFVLLAVVMGWMLITPAEDVVAEAQANDPEEGEYSVLVRVVRNRPRIRHHVGCCVSGR